MKNRLHNQIPSSILKKEFGKYIHCIWHYYSINNILIQWQTLLSSSFQLISDDLVVPISYDEPIVFVVVRNELARMKVFFEHYRKLGVTSFVVLDNGSDDGTLQFVAQQKGTKVYQVTDAYESRKRDGWIEKLLILNGQNRWCVVVDADELLDFVDSERRSIADMIRAGSENGNKRIGGVLLDMYAKGAVFTHSDFFETELRYFDKNSYQICRTEQPGEIRNITVYGGPRDRMFGGRRSLSKQSVFFYDKDTLYINSHYLYPLLSCNDIPCWYVLRHYKFLKSDKKEFLRRANDKCFFNNSVEYQMTEQMDGKAESFYYEEAREYCDSQSLVCLPFLQKISWEVSSK